MKELIDYFSKKVVAWWLFDNQKTDKLISVLNDAIKKEALLQDLLFTRIKDLKCILLCIGFLA